LLDAVSPGRVKAAGRTSEAAPREYYAWEPPPLCPDARVQGSRIDRSYAVCRVPLMAAKIGEKRSGPFLPRPSA
jgi:hypothetical protein